MTEQLLNARELATYLGVSYDWLIDEWEAGRVPGFRLGHKTLRFRRSEVEAWLETKREGPKPPSKARLRAVASSRCAVSTGRTSASARSTYFAT